MPYQEFYILPQEKYTEILSAAICLFSDQPYQSVSVEAIIRSAGISQSSFYQYFEDKKDLYLYILEFGMARKLALVNDLQKPVTYFKTFEYLKLIMQASVQFEIQYPDLARIAYRAFVEETPFPEELDDLAKQGGAAHFSDLLAQGVLHDDVAPWVDMHMATYLLQTVYHSFGHYMINRLKITHPQSPPQSLNVFTEEAALDLFNNLMELLQAGMGRDPEIRKHYYPK